MKKWLFHGLLVVFFLMFLGSAFLILRYFAQSRQQKSAFQDLADIMYEATVPANAHTSQQQDAPPADGTDTPASPYVEVTDPETGEVLQLLPEFARLYTINNHLVGWISIPGTVMDYPVMQTPDTADYYLYKGFDRQYSRHGCIYIKEDCDVFAPSDNLTIYGHRMGDGTMFNVLHEYADRDFYEDHRYITFNTLFTRHKYEIISVFRISSSVGHPFQYQNFVDAADEEEFQDFMDNCSAYALYDTGVSAAYGDKLITLSTCEYTRANGRLVVVAKCVE